jgi:hypothetical protein
MSNIDNYVRRLWLAYRAYHDVSCKNGSDGDEYATASTNGYLEYLYKLTKAEDSIYDWGDWSVAIENHIRILMGFIECYDRPIKRDKITLKTRWTV